MSPKSPPPDGGRGPREAPPAYTPYLDPQLTAESANAYTDGRIDVHLDSKLAKSLAKIADEQEEGIFLPPSRSRQEDALGIDLKLNIVIQIVGSRGDVQPFIALGNALQAHGHRVRIATHDVFENFVKESHLEFFPIGGDPAQLMAYMVKNPGLIPQMKTLRDGEIKKKQVMVGQMLQGCWRSCIEDDPVTQEPFVADAIIANPPSFAHIHCAQALGIPVHLMFTMPWSSTKAFPHPLANLVNGSMENPGTANWVSYAIVEWLTWQGLGDVINRFRSSIDLAPVPRTEGPCLAEALEIPMTYCWSPALVPRPTDWPSHIDVCGFFFSDPPSYTPPPELAHFLESGPAPVYIGFGSIVVEDPQKLINTVLEAVSRAGVRAIVSKGWSELAGPPDPNVFYIGDCPHGWLFEHVAAVVHHGGAGTTACGLLNGKPTAIVPFFGDQPFWGDMVANAGAGPAPIPHAILNAQNLAEAISFCLRPEVSTAAREIAIKMKAESGVTTAVASFHRHLPLQRMRCSIIPGNPAAWAYTKKKQPLTLSKAAMNILVEYQRIDPKDIKCFAINPIIIENRRWDPLTGVLSAAMSTGSNMLYSTGEMFYNPYKEYKASQIQRRSERNLSDQQSSSSTPSARRSNSDPFDTAAKMAGAGLQGFGKFTATYFRGVIVDIPYAAAEGFRRAPQLAGEQPKEYGNVHDWKSGAVVGGKNFVGGMTTGITGMLKHPVKGFLEEGPAGAMKGLAKGAIGMATHMPSAGIGLVAYPFQGISRSIEAAFRTKTPKAIVNARLREGFTLTERMQLSKDEKDEVVQVFDVLISSMGE
ncbi:Sterol 3-beta-glucosyltransferase [Penicillium ucsense]|uniref:Sterol 3-beta-glucosyltransferase n=1 Tax=Penicillium ucsense TaxID=2839758 RepID=A0A8J8W5J1_9EURO|nr:Sterol 3-beta-glucosyltransferase [Penicillium ucsense]KAF7735414.1 Sterol 3-beta-glucosyltransferase [Penicillium ucsense]